MSPAYAEKLRRAESRLAALGMPRSAIAPPAYRAAWRLGLEVPPPIFAGFAFHLLAHALLFAGLWAVAMAVLVRLAGLPIPLLFIGVAAVAAGLAFGLAMALLLRRKARQLSLPSWDAI